MSLKFYKPVTPSQRGLVLVDRSALWKGKPVKTLTEGLSLSGGRNVHGRMTVRHRGGGHKVSYRLVDFKRRKWGVPAVVERLEYDPNRTSFLALVRYEDGEQAYIIAPQKLNVGDQILADQRVAVSPGNAAPLKNIPLGTFVHNVEFKIGKGGQIARSAGSSVQLLGRDMDYVLIKMSSGEVRKIHGNCMGSIGVVSNSDHKNIKLAKAGRRRWKGCRPHVRGVAMNPVDHPMGGGEGKSSGGRHPVSPWGWKTKGAKTRSNKRTNSMILKKGRRS